MSIFNRFCDVVGSNINGLLDRVEDPEKLIKLQTQEMEDTLIDLKAASAGIMAHIGGLRRQRESIFHRIAYWEEKAHLAIKRGRDDLAKEALIEKRRYSQGKDGLTRQLDESESLLKQYKADIHEIEEKLRAIREKERMFVQRHIRAIRQKQVQEEIRRMEDFDDMLRFEAHRVSMHRQGDETREGIPIRKPKLENDLESLALNDEIEKELNTLKSSSMNQMEQRIETLETIMGENPKKDGNHVQI